MQRRSSQGRLPRGDERAILGLGWGRERGPTPPVEVYALEELFARRHPVEMTRVQRPAFHVVVLATAVAVDHMVDFAAVALRPGQLLHVHPGQVMRWSPPTGSGGWIVAAPVGGPLDGGSGWFPCGDPEVRELDTDDRAAVDEVLGLVRAQLRRFESGDATTAPVLAALTQAFGLLVGRGRPVGGAAGPADRLPAPYLAFRRVLETSLGDTHEVAALAAAAGYSVRTVTRACLAATGRTAKRLLDERLMLEARRLLAHTDLPVAEVARRLGYAEPANFSRALRRVTGSSPGALRAG